MIEHNSIPEISVIIPVLHEEKKINSFLSHIEKISEDISIEIIVVDSDPDESTNIAIDSKNIIKLSAPRGRGVQMNTGASKAQGKTFLFLHADTLLPEKAFHCISELLDNNKISGGAFDLGINSNSPLLRLTAYCASLKHRITRVPYGDQAIFLKSDIFKEIHGYKEIPLFEDVDIMQRLKKEKKKITILSLRTSTSARKWEDDGTLYTIFRNWLLQIFFLMGTSPHSLVKFYYRK